MRSRQAVPHFVETALHVPVTAVQSATAGAVADTYHVWLDSQARERVVCKCGGANIWSGDVIEPDIIDRVRAKTTLPVPAVLATGWLKAGQTRRRVAIYEFLDGTPGYACATGTHQAVIRQAGRLLGELHSTFSADRIGEFRYDDGGLMFVEPTTRTLLASPLTAAFPVPTAGDEDWNPVLDHGDYFPGNLLLEDEELVAILDWGNAHVTHAGYALARAEARFVDLVVRDRKQRAALRRELRAGYRERASLPASYDEHAPWFKLLWGLQSGVNLAHVATDARGRRQLRRQLSNWWHRRDG